MPPLRNLTLFVLLISAFTSVSSAQVFRTLAKFNTKNGEGPTAAFVQGLDGDFYSTTQTGGANRYGEVFKINRKGTVTTLHSFNKTDGFQPGGLILASDGKFYGATSAGGAHTYGTLFRISTKGVLTNLYNFNVVDGIAPSGTLIQGADGNLYGTTGGGGEGRQCSGGGCGTVFRMTLTGTLTTLYTFCLQAGCADGAQPVGGLVQGEDGNFYGTTYSGGGGVECGNGCGTAFKITRSGALTTLYSFCQEGGCPDGSGPWTNLVQGNDGNLYGTTVAGGINGDFGTIFQLTPDGSFTTIHSFDGSDGTFIYAPLVQGTDGYFYGVAEHGGDPSCNPPYGCGTIFRVNEEGDFDLLHLFEITDGNSPLGGLMQATSGVFYGTTFYRGPNAGAGTIFGLSMGLGPFAGIPRDSGNVGAVEGILGQDFIGTTDVVFNGVPATFTVRSNFLIVATVPPGATSGFVTVTTPEGTLTSNVPFYVLH